MPTATSSTTATITAPKKSPLKTLRTLYNSAVKAFLNRNIKPTHSLLQSAFDILNNDLSHTDNDTLHILRKWDILRITLETTVYSTPPSNNDFPDELKQMSLKIPSTLVQDMYNRSLNSFSTRTTQPPAVLLPVQVISTLVYSSMKLDAPQVGREIIEEWLARRSNMAYFPASNDGDEYEKVLELYCLHILPKLEEWEYATEFLEYESELSTGARLSLQNSLRTQHVQAVSSRLAPPISSQPSTSSISSRSQSPAPSSSSSSSSLSTASTHTVTPATPRPYRGLSQQPSMTSLPSSASSGSSEGTVTPNGNGHVPNGTAINGNGHSHHHNRKDKGKGKAQSSSLGTPGMGTSVNHNGASTSSSSLARAQSHHPLNPHSPNPLSLPRSHLNRTGAGNGRMSTYALIRASLVPYWSKFVQMGGSGMTALVFMVLIPMVSLVVRWRTRRRLSSGGMMSPNSADVVRRRLRTVNAGENQTKALAMMLVKMWWAFLRSIVDTIRMGVSGLV